MGSQDGSRATQVAAVAGMFLALSSTAIILRCYCRVVVVKSFGLDDWFALVAWLFFVLFCAFALTGVHYGTGKHVDQIPPENIAIGLKWWWACEPVYVLSNMALKISIGIFLLRLAVARVHRVIIWIVMVITTVYGAFFFFLFVLQCRPSAYFWTRYTGGKGQCIDPKITVDATYAYSAVSCLADWVLSIIPVFLVWNLQMNPRTKISVALILAVGAIASTATIIRIPYVRTLSNQTDFLYATVDVAIWSTSETGIGITASALATLRPLFRTFFSKSRLMGSSSHQNNASNPWRSNNGPTNAYAKSKSRGDIEELALTSHAGRRLGVTTVVQSNGGERTTAGPLNGIGGWEGIDRKNSQASSDEDEAWRGQSILKTTASTQVIQ